MPRPITMMSAALVTAAASGFVPYVVTRSLAPPVLPSVAMPPGNLPLPGTGTPLPGNVVLLNPAPNPNQIQKGAPAEVNANAAAGTINEGQPAVHCQNPTGLVTLKPDAGKHVAYIVLRNTTSWPHQVTFSLILLQDRNGAAVESEMESSGGFRMDPFAMRDEQIKVAVKPNSSPAQPRTTSYFACFARPRPTTTLPASGWLRIKSTPLSPSDACKGKAKNVCQEPTEGAELVPVTLVEIPPDSSTATAVVFLGALSIAGFVAIAVGIVLWISGVPPWRRMGGATWSFQQSWGANVTIGAGLLGTLLTAFTFPDHPQIMDRSSYSLLQTLCAAVVILGPLVYGLFRSDVQASVNNIATFDSQGFVDMFLVAGALVLTGALGQVSTGIALVEEFVLSGGIEHTLGRVLEILLGFLDILLFVYGIRSLYLTAKKLSATAAAATGTQPVAPVRAGSQAPAGVPAPLPEWPLL